MTASAMAFVVGGCGGAGGSLVAAAMALSIAADRRPFAFVDIDPDGVHGALAGVTGGTPVADLWTRDAPLGDADLRAACYPHPRWGALVPAPDAQVGDGIAVAARLAAAPERPRVLADAGSGPPAARRVGPGPCVLVITRDAPGLRAAEATRAALPTGTRPVLVINDGIRRADVGHRAAARLMDAERWLPLASHPRDAQRVAAGLDLGRRSRLAALAAELATLCGFDGGAAPEAGDG